MSEQGAEATSDYEETPRRRRPNPTCPSCKVVGIEHLVAGRLTASDMYEVVACDACGHVYGVFQSPSQNQTDRMVRRMQLG
jgi:transcription elongation factor Elf1